MAGFTTTDDGWTFSFGDDAEDFKLPTNNPLVKEGPEIAGYLDDPEKWANYSDAKLYELEVLLRKFIQRQIDEVPHWTRNTKARRYTAAMVFEGMYGRKPRFRGENHDASDVCKLVKLLSYYSSRIQKSGMFDGKEIRRTVYVLSAKRYRDRPPYSLKLRLQWLADKGELPCWQNMRLPKDDLRKGHARNPKTDANIERKRQRAREAYNREYGNRKH